MKVRITSLILLLFTTVAVAWVGPRDSQWKEVDEAMKKGLPKTAIEKLNPIIEAAIKDKAYAEAIKAIGKKIALETTIQGNKPEEKVTRLQAELAKVPKEMKPMMEAMLANWYWHYFQQNRWRFMQRTQTVGPPGDKLTTWDLPRIFAEIDKHFQAALAADDTLKKIPIADYNDLLEKGNSSDSYRPTLFDFVAHETLAFYASGEQAGARIEDAFDLLAESPIFGTTAEFMAWAPETEDEDSQTLKAIRLFQKLLRFHTSREDPAALLDADLLRLEFGNNKAFGTEKVARYLAALKRFTDDHEDHEISARAIHNQAKLAHGEGDWVGARRLAKQGLARFQDSVGGRRCSNLIAQIEARSSRATTERVWNQPLPTVDVHYRNVTKVHFRVVPFDFEAYARSRQRGPENLNTAQRTALLKQRPALAWSANLPATEDFQERTENLVAPRKLKPGSYFLIASHNQAFDANDNQISFAEFWVSDLAIVLRTRQGSGNLEGFVLNAVTGEPLAGASVRSWYRANNRDAGSLPTVRTDKNGLFRILARNRVAVLLHAAHEGHSLSSVNNIYVNTFDTSKKPFEQSLFFTDRAIYRPGQTVHYKGISVAVDQERDSYQAISNRTVAIVFSDVNGKEIQRHQHRTNDYGSFSGSFTAPRDRLMGQMTIRVDGEPRGATQVRVEEYKRPKFQVELAAPVEAAKLNGEVKLTGKATAYTGAAIDGAQVKWRVVRDVRYPVWWYWRCWWMPPQSNPSQEIAHGVARTASSGGFDISFAALPDLAVDPQSEPTFQFKVYADVTDSSGETRTDQHVVNVGYTALAASVSAVAGAAIAGVDPASAGAVNSSGDWLVDERQINLNIRTTTLDGEGQSAEGTLKIYHVRQPDKVHRGSLAGQNYRPNRLGEVPRADLSNPNSWPLGDVAVEEGFSTGAAGNAQISAVLAAGMYRAKIETQDRFGKMVTAELPLQVLDPDAKKLALKVPNLVAAPRWSLQPGEEFSCLWGSGYEDARAFIEIEHRNMVVRSFWTGPGTSQLMITRKVTEAMRGGFTVRITMVRENRAYFESRHVDVPWSNKNLSFKWEHFVSKLSPAEKETWTLVIKGPNAKTAAAEMVASLYDASLDAYAPHQWASGFHLFHTDYSRLSSQFENRLQHFRNISVTWRLTQLDASLTYRHLPAEIAANLYGFQFAPGRGGFRGEAMRGRAFSADGAAGMAPGAATLGDFAMAKSEGVALAEGEGNAALEPGLDLSNVTARKNLNETAFFFPHLLADEDGTVRMEFTMPEALTEWKFQGFAHDANLRGGLLTDKVVTSKDLMVQPNPPRFLREGDTLEFTVKVSNQSPTRQAGQVRLALADAVSGRSADEVLDNLQRDKSFDIAAGESMSLSWRLQVPDDLGFLTYKTVGSTGRLSDGEEGYLPVLSRRVLVTESLPLPIRGKQTKEFDFARLRQSADSDSLKHKSLTVQMVSNPAWYAVMALPYLMEFPHECTEQTFNRLYANALARHIANSDPRIRRVFEVWKNRGGETLDSPLEKNQDLKAVLLEETPWVRDADNESQARRNVGILFDANRLNDETARLMRRLADQQYEDGAWPWFPGGPANDYITLYITTGFGRLRHLGADVDVAPAVKSLRRLDAWADKIYRDILAHRDKDENHLSTQIAFYLYGRSFFLDDQPIVAAHREAVSYWQSQARNYWLQLAHRQSHGHLAVALKRFGDLQTPRGIMASLKERSVSNDELGMFWRDTERSWWWYRAPIETQAMMIEAFDEVMNDQRAVEDCKVWLLKQKQTQDWKTTKATADAVYGLLLRGNDLLTSDALVQVTLGDETVEPQSVEAGTGFYEQRFADGEITPNQGRITVKKVDEGVAWGSVHWQYLEDMSKVTAYDGTPLQLTKQLYTKRPSKKGPVLEQVDGPIQVGDELVVRVVLRTDRDMEYVHLKDYRGSGTEPVNVLSRYKLQDGLYHYESTRDTASHFFIDYLPKGTYVFEYSVRVQHRGQYQTGFAAIECMYAPEFNSHSESLALTVE